MSRVPVHLPPISALTSCPFDGGTRLIVVRSNHYFIDDPDDPDNYEYRVHCTTCACDGPWKKSQTSAESIWNGLPGTSRGRRNTTVREGISAHE